MAGLALIAGFVSIQHTLAGVLVRANPQLAARIAPWDGQIEAASATATLLENLNDGADGRSARLARSALRKDPTAVDAAITLAMLAELDGQAEAGNELFAYALKLSRREFRPHLWAIERAVSDGDYLTALRHYDLAMRTSGYGQEILFPILANAMRQPEIRQVVVGQMLRKPAWRDAFIHYLAVMPTTSETASALYPALVANRIPFDRADALAVVDTLANRRVYEQARSLDQLLGGPQIRTQSRDPGLLGRSGGSAAFDWTVTDVAGGSVSLTREGAKGGADFSIAPQSGGTLLRQIVMAPPSSYRFSFQMDDMSATPESEVSWLIRCESGQQLAAAEVVSGGRTRTTGAIAFAVPDGCPVQIIEFVALNRSDLSDVTGRIVSAGFRPAT